MNSPRVIFSSAIMSRLSLAAEFERKIQALAANEERDKVELLEAIKDLPKTIRSLVSNEDLIGHMLKYGYADFKLRCGRGQEYGFKSFADIRRQFKQLAAAWQDAIEVSFNKNGDRLEVVLRTRRL